MQDVERVQVHHALGDVGGNLQHRPVVEIIRVVGVDEHDHLVKLPSQGPAVTKLKQQPDLGQGKQQWEARI